MKFAYVTPVECMGNECIGLFIGTDEPGYYATCVGHFATVESARKCALERGVLPENFEDNIYYGPEEEK